MIWNADASADAGDVDLVEEFFGVGVADRVADNIVSGPLRHGEHAQATLARAPLPEPERRILRVIAAAAGFGNSAALPCGGPTRRPDPPGDAFGRIRLTDAARPQGCPARTRSDAAVMAVRHSRRARQFVTRDCRLPLKRRRGARVMVAA